MEWTTVQHLDLRRTGVNSKPLQPHAAVFHPTQALVAVAIGTYIVEFDALTGSKISCIDIGAAIVRMSYSPTNSHVVIAIVEDCTIRSCDFDNEQTCVLHSPEKKMEHISLGTEVHLALTPLQPIVFFGFHRRMSVTVVGTADRGRPPTKIKTDLKKPVVNIACHPRHPLLYVAYADGLIRAYNIQTYAVHYTLQLDNTIKLIGAGAFAFHPSLEWIFVGDRRGTLLAWDVSAERPNMIGITQVGSQPITSVVWLPMLQLLVTLSKDGALQVWKTRVVVNPSRPAVQANFFEVAAIESIDIPRILSQCGGEALHVLPRIKSLEVHPKYSLAALVFSDMRGADHIRNRATYTREGRKQLFAVLQSARGSSASVLKEKLTSLGSSGILADHQLQEQLQENHVKGQSHLTMSDIARKAFLCSIYMESHAKSAPISRIPLITIIDTSHPLRDIPVCQPFHLELNFFNKEHRVLHYPVRSFYMDGVNLMGYNICTGTDNIYKKLYNSVPANVGFQSKLIVHSKKKHLFLVVFEFSGSTNDVVLYWENAELHSVSSKGANFKGRDAALIGVNDDQFVILDDDKSSISVNFLPDSSSQGVDKKDQIHNPDEPNDGPFKGSLQFMFDTEIDRIFSTPLESALLFACHGDQIGLATLVQDYNHSSTDGHYISTKYEGRKFIKLKKNETVLQVQWQESHKGYVAGILTTQRVMIVSADLIILAASSTKFDKGIPSFRSLLWVGPALLFSTATAVSLLGWDAKVRTILSISVPYSVLVGALNDRLLLANPTEVNPNREKGVEIKSYLVGLLEPLLLGFVTMQQMFDQKTDLSEILYQITSRFDCLRITPRSLDILAGGSPVCGDLALTLSQMGPQFTQVLRCTYAIKARRFSTALSVLKDEFLRSRDYPRCPTTSHLFHRFRQLGNACINYGQFDSAKETFEVVSDYESLLDLFTCHLNPSAMRSLAQKLEDTGVDSEIRRYCERILRVRSSGWTQGIFANFAAENVAPKGSEWGGGNWEVKTSVNPKGIPRWEVAAEVVPYMKTDDGIIPSIICDHIGVYLGLIKGRGNVVEVREDSLVKAFISMGSNVSDASSVRSNKNMAKGSTGDGDLISLMGLESLGKPTTGSAAEDEQSKTAEEFKASLYGVTADDSSGDEENVSKTKKIQIRIRDKPISSTVVDVNKIKEATKNLKLSDSMGSISRTRSSSGTSQDLGLLLSQPLPPPAAVGTAPAPVISSSTDFFGTDMVIQPSASSQPYSVGTGGVASGPIPEDFFQNTIPSLQVAASLPSTGSYQSKISQDSAKDGDIRKLSSDQFTSFSDDIGFPDGGVPPQANQQINATVDPVVGNGNPISLQTSKPTFQAEIRNGAHDKTMQMSSQAMDLSVLGGPVSSDTGKLPVHPTSVHPGQIPRGTSASVCFKTGLVHLEQNQLPDALSCFDEAFLALAKDQSRAADVKAQATICAQYKIAVTLLQEIGRLQRVQGGNAVGAKEEMGRLSRHLASLPLLARHRISCIRTAIKRNMEVQNYGYGKEMLELLLSKAPPGKQEELRSLVGICVQRGMANKSIDPLENPSHFCYATLSRLSTIGYDACDLCGARFSALTTPGCIVCGMGSIRRSDAMAAAAIAPSPFG